MPDILTCASDTLYGHQRSREYDALVAMGVLPEYRRKGKISGSFRSELGGEVLVFCCGLRNLPGPDRLRSAEGP
jgi:hypothetical protein